MKFNSPAPTAPQWLAFLGSFMVPKGYMEKVGVDAFREKPVGTGPYKLVEYQLNSRIVLERNDNYWGAKPKLRRIIFDIVKDPSARVAAMQSGQVDLTINVPVREVERLQRDAEPGGRDQPDHARDPAAGAQRSRLRRPERAARRAPRDRQGRAVEGVLRRRRGAALGGGDARQPAAISPTSSSNTARTRPRLRWRSRASRRTSRPRSSSPPPTGTSRATTTSRARSSRCGSSVGIEAELETIEYAKYFELNRGAKLPEATLYSWDNATGDPEIFAGYLLNPKMPFSAWKGMEVGEKVLELFEIADYNKRIDGYRVAQQVRGRGRRHHPAAAERDTVVRKKNLNYAKYGNGWILANTMDWS